MIHWEGIAKRHGYEDADDMFLDLYHARDLGIKGIATMFNCAHVTVRTQLLKRGIQIKESGGPHNVKDVNISQEEYETFSLDKLAEMYKVSKSTVYHRTKHYPRKKRKLTESPHESTESSGTSE